jgi:hypothetical protein
LTDGELFFLRASDYLDVRCQLQPWRDRDIVESFELVLVAQQLRGLKQALKFRVLDVNVVKPKPNRSWPRAYPLQPASPISEAVTSI